VVLLLFMNTYSMYLSEFLTKLCGSLFLGNSKSRVSDSLCFTKVRASASGIVL
jgi:hypothetical protein